VSWSASCRRRTPLAALLLLLQAAVVTRLLLLLGPAAALVVVVLLLLLLGLPLPVAEAAARARSSDWSCSRICNHAPAEGASSDVICLKIHLGECGGERVSGCWVDVGRGRAVVVGSCMWLLRLG
jgi:hypothetical protein